MGADEYIDGLREADLLRVSTAGSVDDGKSTLVGRLLSDCRAVCDDHLAAVARDSKKLNRPLDLALLTDGLKAEREQGITIDVAYRYLSTPRRRFIIADTPGHAQYTRNMATGASTADLAVILIDATRGVLTQSKRHGFVACLLGVPHVCVCVNKMDLAGWSEAAFGAIRDEYSEFAAKLGARDLSFIPVSALLGDNVASRSRNTPWYGGPTLLSLMESIQPSSRNLIDFRFPVQLALRTGSGFRGFAGSVAAGVVRPGDEVVALPSGARTRVKSILSPDAEAGCAVPHKAVVLTLEDEIDLCRGDMLARPNNLPMVESSVECMVVWMSASPLRAGKTYVVKHTTRTTAGEFRSVLYRINPDTLHREETSELGLNDIGRAHLELRRPIMCDEYTRCRETGGFVVIDPSDNSTAAAGMVISRARRLQPSRRASTLWLTGLSGSGKTTVARRARTLLLDAGVNAAVLDGDELRKGLCSDLGLSPADRAANVARAAHVARILNDAGVSAIASLISPAKSSREAAREIVGRDRFVEAYCDAPLDVCAARDPKGLYAGRTPGMTGIGSPYEPPDNPDVILRTSEETPEESARKAADALLRKCLPPSDTPSGP